ncbi:hypothetical protein BCR33DRAFT_716583 [Rhizoclosmatium globosum]|uniref:Uncharacterized protein n=1 Tax=Rhizoclosmatium globosum TaxID=329046 RepID=A0A1Y2CE28_9FUNG|nr:hypothetical protein BCR33DRAFT_716583 [Rhizoclosmatium globosum]|eukprot:ORY45299.1 hypothetical protein BCR33DRAFT_716583 [Rhizoclosmatium globosum]
MSQSRVASADATSNAASPSSIRKSKVETVKLKSSSPTGTSPPKGRRNLQLGVNMRTPMGEFIVEKGGYPLSSLSNPTPGPLTYDPKLPPSGFQYSILGKHVASKLEQNPIGPGPSKYNVSEDVVVFNDAPHWSFGIKLGELMKVDNENPSPFAYDNTKRCTPSPDRYNPNLSCIPVAGANPKYSFGLKTKPSEDNNPGPQDYDVHYIRSNIADAPSYTMRPRVGEPVFTNKEDALIPGANEYNPKLPGTGKAASLKGSYKEIKSMKTPGPANYIIPNSLFNGPQYSLTGRNVPEEEDLVKDLPSPASYNPQPTFDSPPQFSLGNRRKEQLPFNHYVPGPGAYEPKDRQIRGNGAPKVTLKGRHSQKPNTNPGPADYNTAAPIERTLSAAHLHGWRRVRRKFLTIVEKCPGPADYELKPVSTVKPAGPKYSLATRIAPFKVAETPGPNRYAARKPLDGPKITMKSRSSPFVLVFPSQRVDTLRLGN